MYVRVYVGICISYHHIIVVRLIHTAVAVAVAVVIVIDLDRSFVGWYGSSTRTTTVRRTIFAAGGGGGGFGGGCGVV